jgi:Calcineurin-like phosphoesterase
MPGDHHGSAVIDSINAANAITFHAIGDSGATKQSAYASEIKVADAITNDFHSSSAADRPSFLYHLGDVVYNFGESNYYYDQFYEPFRNYAAPIFAVPGNHVSFILPGTAKGEAPLTTFTRSFCGTSLVVTKEAGSLHRTCMLQPGVYFALDAPFVRILGLFSNALEDPGVISSESGSAAAANRKTAKSAGTAKWPAVPDYQLAFLSAQLEQIKSSNYPGAVIIAVHHPPFTYSPQGAPSGGGTHYGSPIMLSEIDAICQQIGVYPHAVLSGHAHNYQRYTRNLTFNGKKYSVPFIICGDSDTT